MTLAEKIKALQKKMGTADAARTALVEKSVAEDRSLTDDEVTQFNGYSAELDADHRELGRLQIVEKSVSIAAVAVPAVEPAAGPRIEVKSNAPKGSAFTRTAMVLAKSKGNLMQAERLVETHYKDDDVTKGIIKAAVAVGSTQVSAWAGNLVYPEAYAADFIELLYPLTVLGRLDLHKVPFNVRISGQTSGTSVGWVGEGKRKPVTSAGFNAIYLTWAKVAAIAVMSDELIRFSNPAAEALVQRDLLRATAQGIDMKFLSADAAVANVSPAGMLNGSAVVAATGTGALNLIADVQTLLAPAIAANYDLSSAVFVMSPARALAVSSMRNALGAPYFPTMNIAGGYLENVKVIVSNNIPATEIVLLIQDEIYLTEDAGPQIDISTEASIVMDSDPDNATSEAVSMFQTNSVAIRVEQWINFAKRRNLAASYITGANYSGTAQAAS